MSRAKRMHLIKFIIFSIIAVIMVAPMVWALSVSLAAPGKAFDVPPKLFALPLHFENYVAVMRKFDFLRYFMNSVFVCVVSIIGVVISNSMIGFGLAKYESKGMQRLFFIGLCTMYVPSVTMMVSTYVMWSKVGVLDSYLPMILPLYFGSAVWVFLMRQNFKSIGNSFFEAAYIDGANPFYIFWKIYMPLSKPVIATLVLRAFMSTWNDLMNPLIYITTKDKYTVALALSSLRSMTAGREEINMAGVMIGLLPVMIVYLFAQKYFVGGEVASGVKG